MKTHFTNLLMASASSILLLTACSKENVLNSEEDAALDFRATPSSLNITADWAQGAASLLNGPGIAPVAQTNTVKVWNNLGGSSGRLAFQRWDQLGTAHIGRTNGAGDNGTATHAFAYRAAWGTRSWIASVPFAFGTRINSTREAIWTPSFVNAGIPTVATGQFTTDNVSGQGDEDPAVGVIEVGDFRAIDTDVLPNNLWQSYGVKDWRNVVIIQNKIGTQWRQIARTNGEGDNGNLLSFTVLKVRTNYTVSAGKVTAQTIEDVPIIKTYHTRDKKNELRTPLLGQNIGTAGMYRFP